MYIGILITNATYSTLSVRGDETYEDLEILKDVDATMLLHDLPYTEDRISRVHAARR
jgi:(E)-4-hydroxy-3-methylbut-2-enyl-diphosphate synthase